MLLWCELCSVVTPRVTIQIMDKINQSEVNVTFNTMFKMNCSVESYPPAMVHWEVDGVQVSNNPEIRTYTRVLEEVTVDTSSRGVIITYTCVAVNVINGVNHSANNSINVIIQGKTIHLAIFIVQLRRYLCSLYYIADNVDERKHWQIC